MTPDRGGIDETRAYYDEFSKSYERHRRPNSGDGYHALVDDQFAVCIKHRNRRRAVVTDHNLGRHLLVMCRVSFRLSRHTAKG